jgi:outer membrane biosynthesis protein TonB
MENMSATKPSKSAKAKPVTSAAKPAKAAKPVAKKATKVKAKAETQMLFKGVEKTEAKPTAKPVKKAAAKSAAPKKPTRSAAKALTPAEEITTEIQIVVSNESIATRAYYISERRQAMGWPGDSETDWLEALNQLTAEAKRRKP